MKIKYLGTGGCEGVPALFCHCENCKKALRLGGKDLRSRANFLIDDKLMIDFPADAYWHVVANKIDLSAVSDLLFTHSHSDHLYADDLMHRCFSSVDVRTERMLRIYGNDGVKAVYERVLADFEKEDIAETFSLVQAGDEFTAGEYTVTAFKTTHMSTEDSLIYLIRKGGKAYLHLIDSAYPAEEVIAYLVQNKVRLNAITADCTFGNMHEEYFGHMNVWQNARLKERLEKESVIDENTKYVLSHFSHYTGDTYDSLKTTAEKFGMIVSYDGMELEI